MYCLTKFAVLENYTDLFKVGETEWIIDRHPGKQIQAKLKNRSLYNPLEDAKELYMELNKVIPEDPKTIMKFVRTYGLPIGANLDDGDKEIKAIYRMELQELNEKLKPFQKIISVWQAIKNNTEQALETIKKEFQLMATLDQIHEFSGEDNYEEILRNINADMNNPTTTEEFKSWLSVKDEDLKVIALTYISVLLNKQSLGKRQHKVTNVTCERSGKLVTEKAMVEAISFNNLFEVAYYQLSKAIPKKEIRKCDHCEFPFELTHERQHFCPPLLGRKRSTCENTYNQRIKRQRKKEDQNNKSMDAPLLH